MTLCIRPLDPTRDDEVELVATRMRATLVEVVDSVEGQTMYTMKWLRQRVRWHLDPEACEGEVFVAEGDGGAIVGHTIVRVETAEGGAGSGSSRPSTSPRRRAIRASGAPCSRGARRGCASAGSSRPLPSRP
jgi:hypothetical protein